MNDEVQTPEVMPPGALPPVQELLPKTITEAAQERAIARLRSPSAPAVAVPLPDDVVFPRLYDAEAQREAYRLFLGERQTFETIAAATKIPLVTVLQWASMGDWIGRRDRLMQVQERDEAQQLSIMRIGKRKEALEAQIATSGRIQGVVDKHLKLAEEEENGPGIGADSLKKLSDAAKAAADVATRALGLNEGGATGAEAAAAAANTQQKAPLVVIVPGGGLPIVRQA